MAGARRVVLAHGRGGRVALLGGVGSWRRTAGRRDRGMQRRRAGHGGALLSWSRGSSLDLRREGRELSRALRGVSIQGELVASDQRDQLEGDAAGTGSVHGHRRQVDLAVEEQPTEGVSGAEERAPGATMSN